MTELIRLHITPLTPDILPSVLPPSIRSTATDISFHAIPTFPENSYGYVTLPKMDAEKIKKKLNGSILKGRKFKIETARPQKRQIEEDEADPEPTKEKRKSKKHKSDEKKSKSKDDHNTMDGYELSSDRKVKRGWTDPNSGKRDRKTYDKSKSKEDKKAKPQPKSKYSENPECLFRTSIPANRASQSEEEKKKAKKDKKSADNVVHEFAKTYTHPSFLRTKDDKSVPTTEFDEEKGWIDSTGTVKEPPSEKTRKKDYRPGQVPGAKEKRPVLKARPSKTKSEKPESSAESEDWTSSSGSSDEGSDSDSDSESESENENENEKKSESDSSSSSDDSDSDSDSAANEKESDKPATHKAPAKATEDDAMAVDDSKTEATPAKDTNTSPKEVHPLEALFKRSAPAESEVQTAAQPDTGFSFFGNADDIESEDEPQATEPQTPFTPFNKRELQDRGLRSAAPTPDTGLASRHMKWSGVDDMEDDEDDEVAFDTPVSKARETDGKKDETEFAKWFWENRGDNNRAWKKRRRDAAKEQRQRENRKKGMKGRS